MPKPSRKTKPVQQSKPSRRPAFKLAYIILSLITAAALATPPATAANLIPDVNIGALTMISSVAILMLVLVIEIWRQTAKNASPGLKRQMVVARRKNRKLLRDK